MKNKIIFKTLMLKGEAGSTIVSMEKTGHVGTADIYTITFNDGSTTEISIENMSAITSVEKTSSTDTEDIYTITCADGSTQTFSVLNHNADIAAMSDNIDVMDARLDNFLATQTGVSNGTLRTETTLFSSTVPSMGNDENNSGYFDLEDSVDNYDEIVIRYSAFSGKSAVVTIKPDDIPVAGGSDSPMHWSEIEPNNQITIDAQNGDRSVHRFMAFTAYKFIDVDRVSIDAFVWGWNGSANSNGVVSSSFTKAWNSTNGAWQTSGFIGGIYSITGIKYEEAGTSKDPELADLRVGADGTTYNSAGAAVRGHISKIYDDMYTVLSIGDPVPTAGLISGLTGQFTENQYFTASDYIDISTYVGVNIRVKCSLYQAAGFAFYNSNKTFISGYCGTDHGSNEFATVNATVPETAKYIRLCVMSTQGTYTDCGLIVLETKKLYGEINHLNETKDYTKRLILPPFIRMAEGIEYSFHHDNMIQGFCSIDCDFFGFQFGAHYDDFSVITPDSTKSAHSNIFNTQNGQHQNINAKFIEPDVTNIVKGMYLRACKNSDGNGKTLKGIFIGDSFTEAGKYLKNLIDTCTSNGITLQSIGTISTTVSGSVINHEGRSGWKTSDYATKATVTISGNERANPFWHNDAFDFSYYMSNQGYSNIDFVAVFTGVNDSIADSAETILSALTTIINSIRTYSATIPILLWLTPTRCIAPTSGIKRRYYNQAFTLVDCDQAQRFNCVVVDNFSDASNVTIVPVGFNVDPMYDYVLTEQNRNTENTTQKRYMCSDPIHLNNNGYKHISDVIYGTVLYLASVKE